MRIQAQIVKNNSSMRVPGKEIVLMQSGFTLLELLIVTGVILILASLALPNFSRTVEKNRTAEARNILGLICRVQEVYYNQHGIYASDPNDLGVKVPASPCRNSYYFYYTAAQYETMGAVATRCTAGGKNPNVAVAYTIRLYPNGTWLYSDPQYQ